MKLLLITLGRERSRYTDVDAYVNDLDKIRLLNESCDNVTEIDLEYDHFEMFIEYR
jgi:hypothetical protein